MKISRNKRKHQGPVEAVTTTIGCLPTQALAFLAVFVYATQAIAFEWKPGLTMMLLTNELLYDAERHDYQRHTEVSDRQRHEEVVGNAL